MEQEHILLMTVDNVLMPVDLRFKACSELVRTVLEDSSREEQIPLPFVLEKDLKTVMDFCILHDFNLPPVQKPLKTNDLSKNLSEKNYEFIKSFPDDEVSNLLNIANYLDIKPFMDVCLAKLLTPFFVGLDDGNFRNLCNELKMKPFFSLEEERQYRQRYPWAFSEGEISLFEEFFNESKK